MPKVGEEVAVKMTNENNEVLVKAKELAEALFHSEKKKDSIVFLSLLIECNALIQEITKIDFGTICSRSQGGCC